VTSFFTNRKRKAQEEAEEEEKKRVAAEWNKNFEVSLEFCHLKS